MCAAEQKKQSTVYFTNREHRYVMRVTDHPFIIGEMVIKSPGEALSTFIRASRDPKGEQEVWVAKSLR